MWASESVVDILGYQPHEVVGRSCFEYFHPEEVPIARLVHNRGVQLDKAAVLHYARIQDRHGQWISCECVFTVVYDVLVACTSIYRGDEKNERKMMERNTLSLHTNYKLGRAAEAPAVRHLFASSPKDPRYHMLEHLSSKFRAPPSQREPRAALILNRFSRTLTVTYATDAVSSILGVTADQLNGKSFYECMQERCLPDAIRCLESAKANDSIAYLRFWYRDPRRLEDLNEDQVMRDASASSDSEEDGGVLLSGHKNAAARHSKSSGSVQGSSSGGDQSSGRGNVLLSNSSQSPRDSNQIISFGESTDFEHDAKNKVFEQSENSSNPSVSAAAPANRGQSRPQNPAAAAPAPAPVEPFEVEAVVSCTSDGLVVVMRRARPPIPQFQTPAPAVPQYPQGLFAAPWGADPIRPHQYQPIANNPFQHGFQAPLVPPGGPPVDEFMNSIREVAVFAWSLTGINGNIASYGHGIPRGEAVPPSGIPIWDPYAQPSPGYLPPMNQAEQRWIQRDQRANPLGQGHQLQFQIAHQQHVTVQDRGYGAHRYLGSLNSGYAYQGPGNYLNNHYEYLFVNPATRLAGAYRSNESQTGNPNEIPGPQIAPNPQEPGGANQGPDGNRNHWY